jgi:hypothetical protein
MRHKAIFPLAVSVLIGLGLLIAPAWDRFPTSSWAIPPCPIGFTCYPCARNILLPMYPVWTHQEIAAVCTATYDAPAANGQ